LQDSEIGIIRIPYAFSKTFWMPSCLL